MNSEIDKNSFLCRCVSTCPTFFNPGEHRVSSALFKDSKGVSVDADGQRKGQDIMCTFNKRFGEDNTSGVVYINNTDLNQLDGVKLVKNPTDEDEYHCLIIKDGKGKSVELGSSKARKLAKLGHTVKNKLNDYMDRNSINYEKIW